MVETFFLYSPDFWAGIREIWPWCLAWFQLPPDTLPISSTNRPPLITLQVSRHPSNSRDLERELEASQRRGLFLERQIFNLEATIIHFSQRLDGNEEERISIGRAQGMTGAGSGDLGPSGQSG
jgi:hypothetical protein